MGEMLAAAGGEFEAVGTWGTLQRIQDRCPGFPTLAHPIVRVWDARILPVQTSCRWQHNLISMNEEGKDL